MRRSFTSQLYSQVKSDQLADDLVSGLDTKQYVGHRHHIVPKFILRRFADDAEQVYVRDRAGGFRGRQNVKNLAVKDFYTFIDKNDELNSSHESILGFVENDASSVLRDHLDNPFRRSRPFSDDERTVIDTLVAMQAVRGHELRRIGEILTDYYVKLTNRAQFSDQDLTEYEVVPHQNDLLNEAMQKADVIYGVLADRACALVTIDRPLLVTCDAPVIVLDEDDAPDKAHRQFNGIPRTKGQGAGHGRDLIMISGSNLGGIANADTIVMPIGPDVAIAYDAPGSAGTGSEHIKVEGDRATAFAGYILEGCIKNACAWIIAHPDHRTIATMRLPKPKSPLTIDDGGTPMSKRNETDSRRTARRLDRNPRSSR